MMANENFIELHYHKQEHLHGNFDLFVVSKCDQQAVVLIGPFKSLIVVLWLDLIL